MADKPRTGAEHRDGQSNDRPAPEAGDDPANPAGRVTFDNKGRALWEWHRSADPAEDSTEHLLKRLDNPDLKLEETQRVRKGEPAARGEGKPASGGPEPADEDALGLEDEPDGGGFDPYDSGPPRHRWPGRRR